MPLIKRFKISENSDPRVTPRLVDWFHVSGFSWWILQLFWIHCTGWQYWSWIAFHDSCCQSWFRGNFVKLSCPCFHMSQYESWSQSTSRIVPCGNLGVELSWRRIPGVGSLLLVWFHWSWTCSWFTGTLKKVSTWGSMGCGPGSRLVNPSVRIWNFMVQSKFSMPSAEYWGSKSEALHNAR